MRNQKTIPRICQYCETKFLAEPGQIKKGTGKFCSISCSISSRNKALVKTPEEIFRSKILKIDDNGCWIYKGESRYGKLIVNNKTMLAHRFSYELHNGKIPDNMLVCHKCDVTYCVNPEHLFLGTSSDNRQDMMKKGRDNFPRGSKQPNAYLNEQQISVIKRRILNGEKMHSIIKEYNVTRAMMYQMKSGRSWKHVLPANDL